jgi:hypothetical protein
LATSEERPQFFVGRQAKPTVPEPSGLTLVSSPAWTLHPARSSAATSSATMVTTEAASVVTARRDFPKKEA